MAVRTYNGTDGNWNNPANWNGAAVPIDGDTVVFPAGIATSLTSNLTQSGIDLDLLWVQAGFLGAIGASGNTLALTANTMLVEGGTGFYYDSHLGSGAEKTDCIIVRLGGQQGLAGVNTSIPIELGAKSGNAGEIDFIHVVRGKVTLTTATGVNELCLGYMTNSASDAQVVVNSAAGTIALVNMTGGSLNSSQTITALHADGGVHTQALNTVTNMYLKGSAKSIFNANSTITIADLGGQSSLDLMQDAQVKTITELRLRDQCKLFAIREVGSVHILPTLASRLYHDMRASN